eukprot:1040490-Rhodomonas_salina.1
MPVDVHCSTSVQTPSRCSHAVHNHQETVHPVVSYKIGYFKHVCTASVFKQVNNLRRKLESGADWASLEAVQELHKYVSHACNHHSVPTLSHSAHLCCCSIAPPQTRGMLPQARAVLAPRQTQNLHALLPVPATQKGRDTILCQTWPF